MRKLVLVSVMVSLLSACQSDDQFLGKWVWIKNDCSTLEVVQNGDRLLAKISTPNVFMIGGGYSKVSAPAVAKDGVLTIQLPTPLVMTIEKASGELIGGNDRYRRPDGNEKCAKKDSAGR